MLDMIAVEQIEITTRLKLMVLGMPPVYYPVMLRGNTPVFAISKEYT